MSTDVAVAATTLPDPAERGTTTLADRVVEKVAARAAGEVAHTAELSRSIAERLPGRAPRHARATAQVTGRVVQLRVTIGVEYPQPVLQVTRAVRSHVRDTVSRLCGLDVRSVDVVVDRLRRPEGAGRRVL